jgi:hypothetical protein
MRSLLIAATAAILLMPAAGMAQVNTLQDARVGEWAVYATGNGQQERHSVTARRRSVVIVKVDMIINGRVINSTTEDWDVDDSRNFEGATPGHQITAGGRTYNCFAVQRGQRTFYYSNEVPVTGLVAIHRGGQVIKQVVNFEY